MREASIGEGLLEAEARQQRLMAGGMLGIGIVVCAAFAVFDALVTGYWLDATVEAVGVVVYAVALRALVLGRALRLVVHVLTATTTVIVMVAVLNGQAGHSVLVWPLAVPPLAFLLVGLRWGWVYVVAVLAASGGLIATYQGAQTVLLANFSGAFLIITLLTLYFALARRHAVRALRRAAETDVLTQVANRRSFLVQYAQVRASLEEAGQPLALLVIDADRFKSINDTAGHEVGDRALVHLAQVMAGQLRETDVLARMGGEEFAVLLPATPLPEAVARAEVIRRAVAESVPELPVPGGRLTVSIGAALAEPGDDGFAAHFARADERLFAAKAAGRNCVVADDRVADAAVVPA